MSGVLYAEVSSLDSIPSIGQLELIEGNGKRVRVVRHVASKWDELADRLRFELADSRRIERDYVQHCEGACRTVFVEWLIGHSGSRSPINWHTVVQVLNEIGFSEVASELQTILSN